MGVGRFPQVDESRPRGARRAGFLRGLASTSPLAMLFAALLLVPAILGLEALFVSGAWSSVPLEYWLRKSSDDYVYVSWTVARNRQDPPGVPGIYVLGGSSARESIVGGASLARRVEAAGGPRVVAYDLGSPNQNFAQSLAVADNVPLPALLVVGVNLGRFTPSRGANQQQAVGKELLLESEYLRDHIKGIAPQYRDDFTILPGVFSFLTSYADQQVRGLLAGRLPGRTYGQHRYNQRYLHPVAEKEAMVRKWNKRRAPVFEKNLEFNLGMLEQLLERSRERGVDVVLVELPRNEEIIAGRFDWALAMYQPRVRELAERYGVPYIDFSQDLGLGNEDFHDLSHLVEPGRELWEQRLAEELAAFYARQGTAGTDSAGEAEDAP
jgi:hypothetical protein